MEKDILTMWSRIRDLAKNDARYSLISPWIHRLEPKSLHDDTLFLVLDDVSLAPFLTSDHMHMIGEAASPDTPMHVALDRTEPSIKPYSQHSSLLEDINVNHSMTLDSFHVGISNRLAFAAIHAIIDQPGVRYNPVFIHGAVGMGKTHLLQAAYQGLRATHSQKHIRLTDGSTFLSMVEEAHKQNTYDTWIENFIAQTDILLMDDTHHLAGQLMAEEALFTVFNAFYESKKQLLLTGDCAPRRIRHFSDRLSSRFHWGLIIELEMMTEDMRRTIICERMNRQGIMIPEDVQEFIAHQITTNIRELEGAILKLLGYSSLLDIPITLHMAKDALGEYLEQSTHTPTIDDIQKCVCQVMDVSLDALLSASRTHSIAYPRQIAMFLSRELTSTSLEEIGRRFGGRDHSTVKYGCEKIRDLAETDTRTRNMVRMIRDKIQTFLS